MERRLRGTWVAAAALTMAGAGSGCEPPADAPCPWPDASGDATHPGADDAPAGDRADAPGEDRGGADDAGAPPEADASGDASRRDPARGHPYPRRAIMLWGGAWPEWYARFDLIMSRETGADFAREIKALNPDAYVLAMPGDWNVGAEIPGFPEGWCVHDSTGGLAPGWYGGSCWADYSDYAEPSPGHEGLRFNEYVGRHYGEGADMTLYDGLASDGVWENPYSGSMPDVDLDHNGANDWDEYGREWLTDRWDEGREIMISGIRERIGDERIILLNSGRFHEFDWAESNGMMLENTGCEWTFEYTKRIYSEWMRAAPPPHALMWDATRLDGKEDFSQARFQLASAMYGDGYVLLAGAPEHHFVDYFDEFDVDLGFPTGEMQLVRATGDNGRGVYARFFDNGAVLLNQSRDAATVTDDDLRALAGYAGPYYRFRGNQDPAVNDGEPFSSDVLDGRPGCDDNSWIGDGRILTRQETTAVAEIIVDDVWQHTSPASDPAELEGPWTRSCDEDELAWAQGCRPWRDQWALAYDESGSGEARFAPAINVPGEYEVWEWHGGLAGREEASAVVHRIARAGGTDDVVVDQRAGQGRWNLLGVFAFDGAPGQGVTIVASGADGAVIADAVRFVHRGNRGHVRPPPAPRP